MSSTKFQWALSNFIPFRSLPAYPIFQDKPEDQNHAQQSITLKTSCKIPELFKSEARIRSQPIIQLNQSISCFTKLTKKQWNS